MALSGLTKLTPVAMRGYKRSWLVPDLVAGVTLAAIGIPEVLGYTSISQTPLVTGLYTIIFPTMVFALLGASRLLVVGADSATAATLAAGLAGLGIAGLQPESPEWVALCGLTALVCGAMLLIARLLKLGFIGDFMSASVLVGFLSGVGIQVLGGQIPAMLGIPKGSGRWIQQQWDWISNLSETSWATAAYAGATLLIILVFKRFAPRIPGALIAVVLLTAISASLDSKANGVKVVGALQGGFPPIGLPQGLSWSDVGAVIPTAFACFVLIIAQSAATARSFAMKRGEGADVNRDLIGLSGASLAAGLSGTFVVNGSPTKTQILDEQKGRTQVANLALAAVALIFTMFFTGLLADMPKSVLAAIVFLIGVDLIDVAGLRRIYAMRRSEFVVASLTGVVVFAIGVEQGIVLAIVASVIELVRRQYSPKDYVVDAGDQSLNTFLTATPGTQSAPGLIVFRYDADLFYANASRFVDDVESLIAAAPDPVRWLVLDASALSDVDYSAGLALSGLLDYLDARSIVCVLARADDKFIADIETYGLGDRLPTDRRYAGLNEAIAAFQAQEPSTGKSS